MKPWTLALLLTGCLPAATQAAGRIGFDQGQSMDPGDVINAARDSARRMVSPAFSAEMSLPATAEVPEVATREEVNIALTAYMSGLMKDKNVQSIGPYVFPGNPNRVDNRCRVAANLPLDSEKDTVALGVFDDRALSSVAEKGYGALYFGSADTVYLETGFGLWKAGSAFTVEEKTPVRADARKLVIGPQVFNYVGKNPEFRTEITLSFDVSRSATDGRMIISGLDRFLMSHYRRAGFGPFTHFVIDASNSYDCRTGQWTDLAPRH